MPETQGQTRARFELTAGRLVRRHLCRIMRSAAWARDLEIDIQEDRGWLSSSFWITVTGSQDGVDDFTSAWEEFREKHGGDEEGADA